MAFAVSQEKFSGPLELLLALIEEKKLTITEVSLKSVADEYLAYLEANEVPSEELADFLLVASRLIYLKSRELMPYLRLDEEDAGAAKLEDQLLLYREFVAAAVKLEERYLKTPLYRRPYVRPQREAQFAPGRALSAALLVDGYRTVLKRLEPFFALSQTSLERVKSIEERIEELTGALRAKATMRFKDVVAAAGSRVEVVVSFLALLELLRRRSIRATQSGHYGEIMIERNE